jgi:tRNA threonylcarbamoyladenosine biosynthesis protein TsaB
MARILAIDTTGEFGSIALYDGVTEHAAEVSLHSPEGFGHILFDRIAALLEREGWRTGDVDCFASASGPGSFTGVRVGLTAAKGLAEASGKPVVAVSNLKALALSGTGPVRATVIDARRGEIYGAVYSASLDEIRPERVTKFQAWLDEVPDGAEFIGVNIAPFTLALAASPRFREAVTLNASASIAPAIARIAHTEYVAGRAMDPAAVDANYVRRSDAELFWKEM